MNDTANMKFIKISGAVHRRLKIRSANSDEDMQVIASRAIDEYLSRQSDDDKRLATAAIPSLQQ